MSEVRVAVSGIERIDLRTRASMQAVQHALDKTAVDAETLIEAGAGVHAKTGALERSIFKARVAGGWELGHDSQVAPHARFVHDGTRAHVIVPNKRKMLRWPGPGGFIFARKVEHPGYKGDAWLRRAANQALPIFERHLASTMQGV